MGGREGETGVWVAPLFDSNRVAMDRGVLSTKGVCRSEAPSRTRLSDEAHSVAEALLRDHRLQQLALGPIAA